MKQLSLAAFTLSLLAGCNGSSPEAKPARTTTTVVAPTGPSQVEIGEPTASWQDDNVVQFSIPYKFTSGGPNKVYQWRISFPGTNESGIRPTEGWEMQPEGTQKTGIQVNTTEVSEFKVELHEADAADKPFHLISNVVTGKLEPKTPAGEAKP